MKIYLRSQVIWCFSADHFIQCIILLMSIMDLLIFYKENVNLYFHWTDSNILKVRVVTLNMLLYVNNVTYF